MATVKEMRTRIGSVKSTLTAVCVIFLVGMPVPVFAQNAKARAMIETSEQNMDSLTAKISALKGVTDVISADCGAKLPDDAKIDGFCRCGAAVTMALWRAGGDGGKMLKKLADYANNPTEGGAADFVNYQGPELYKPVCELALRKN